VGAAKPSERFRGLLPHVGVLVVQPGDLMVDLAGPEHCQPAGVTGRLEGFHRCRPHVGGFVLQGTDQRLDSTGVTARLEGFHRPPPHRVASVVQQRADQCLADRVAKRGVRRLGRVCVTNRVEGFHRRFAHVRVLVLQRADQRLDRTSVTGRLEGFHRLFAHL